MTVLGAFVRDIMRENMDARNFRIFAPDETASNRLSPVFEVTGRRWVAEATDSDEFLDPDGRVIPVVELVKCVQRAAEKHAGRA